MPYPVGLYSRMSWVAHFGKSINIKSIEENYMITTKHPQRSVFKTFFILREL